MNKPPCMVWLPSDHRMLGEGEYAKPYLVLGDKYARAVSECAAAQPVVFPLVQAHQMGALLEIVDGVMLTGSPSNVHPSHFGEGVADPALPLDPERDALTLELVHACVAQAVPLLGICRGFQEINVALGGSLYQQVQIQPGMMDHREPANRSTAEQYAARHKVRLVAGSPLERWAGAAEAQVNSLHGQGVNRLADGLRALAHAPDGLVEAFEVVRAPAFALAVQWHPEWLTAQNPFYLALFRAFGDACRARHTHRVG
ncbi:MAG: gamma-glutamyl-gamma-aminobutyrate hydrolase family protein [Rhodoferax sp.]